METKKNEVKVLATIMAFAMVFVAGFAIIGGVDSDAVASEATGVETAGATTAAGDKNYFLSGSAVAVTAPGEGKTVNLFLKNGIEITITYNGSEGTVNLYAATSDVSSGKVTYDNGLKLTITSSNSSSGLVVKNDGGKLVVTSTTIDSDVTFGVKSTLKETAKSVYYPIGASVDFGSLKAADEGTVLIKNATSVIIDKTATSAGDSGKVTFKGIESSAGVQVNVTGANGLKISGTFTKGTLTMDSGKATVDTDGITDSTEEGGINAFANGLSSGNVLTASPVPGTSKVYGNVSGTIRIISAVDFTNVTGKITLTNNANPVVTRGVMTVEGFTGQITNDEGRAEGPAAKFTGSNFTGNVKLDSGVFVYAVSSAVIGDGTDAVSLSIGVNAVLYIPNLEVEEKSVLNVYGEIKTASDSANITGEGEFNAYSGAVIGQTITITTEKMNISGAMEEYTVHGKLATNATYNQTQIVRVDDDLTILPGVELNIHGKFIIDEGVTVTIKNGARLVIDSSSADVIILGTLETEYKDGSFGTFNVQSAKSVEISGKIDSSGNLTINSNTVLKSGARLDVNDNGTIAVSQGLTIDAGATARIEGTINGTTTNIDVKGALVLNGSVACANVNVNLVANGAQFSLNSAKITGTSATITISDSALVYAKDTDGNDLTIGEDKENNITVVAAQGNIVKNVAFVENFTTKTNDDGTKTYINKMDISGAATVEREDTNSAAATITLVKGYTAQKSGITVEDRFSYGKGIGFSVGSDLSVSGVFNQTESDSTVVTVTSNGAITVTGEMKTKIKVSGTINAAMYETEESGIKFYNYTTLAKAIESGVKEIDVLGTVTIDSDLTIPAGFDVDAKDAIVKIGTTSARDVTVKIEDGAKFSVSNVYVEGTLEVAVEKTGLKKGNVVSDVYTTNGTSGKYTNIYGALSGSKSGDVITITKQSGSVELKQNLVIPEGVTLSVPAGKEVTVFGNITITVDGTLFAWDSIKTATGITFSDEKVDKAQSMIIVNGVLKSNSPVAYSTYKVAGAYYTIVESDGTFNYVAPVATAAQLTDKVDDGITIEGTNKVGSVTFNGGDDVVRVVLAASSKVTAENIKLVNVNFDASATKQFDGTVSSEDGSVVFANAKGMVVRNVTSDGSSKTTLGGTIVLVDAKKEFSVAIDAGIIYGANALDVCKLIVNEGAEFAVTGTGIAVEFDNLVVYGTVTASNAGSITSAVIEVMGTLNQKDATTTEAAGAITVSDKLFVGNEMDDAFLGAAAAVNGSVRSYVVFVYDGSTVDERITKDKEKTEFMVEGVPYVTVYDATGAVKINNVKFPALAGAEVESWQFKDANGKMVDVKSTDVIGDYDAIEGKMDYNVYHITFTVDSGVSDVYIDGALVNSLGLSGAKEFYADIAAGNHTVTYKLKTGYGGDVKISLDGKDLTDGKFTISKDQPFVDKDGKTVSYKVVITGVETSNVVDNSGSSSSNDGMGITDILLIVLVILAAVLVVIVAIRMMRS